MSTPIARDFYTSMAFDGVDDAVSTASNLPALSSFTYVLWAKKKSFTGSVQAVMGDHVGSEYPVLLQAADGSIQLYDVKNAATMIDIGYLYQWRHSNWIHIAASYDASAGVCKLYRNGAPLAERGYAAGNTYGPSRVAVGRYASGSYFNGNIDEPAVYSRALTPEEVRGIYLSGTYPGDAVMFFRFDEGVGTAPQPGFPGLPAGGFTGGPLYSPDVPLAPPLIDIGARVAFYSDDFNDAILAPAAGIYAGLQGASCVVIGCWARALSIAGTFTPLFIPNSSGATGISIVINTLYQIAANARSRDAGAVVSPSTSYPFRHSARAWRHVAVVADYGNDVADMYVDGVRAATASGASWEDDTYQCGATANIAMPAITGAGNALGLLSGPMIGRGRPTQANMRRWFLDGTFPVELIAAYRFNGFSIQGSGLMPTAATINGSPLSPFGMVEAGPFW